MVEHSKNNDCNDNDAERVCSMPPERLFQGPLKSIHRDRLETLANFLDTVPARLFDLTTWGGSYEKPFKNNLCNSVGCAVGWATELPEFKNLGLKLLPIAGSTFRASINFNGHDGFYAVELFFGMTKNQVNWLFDSAFYMKKDHHNPHVVASRIREFLFLLDTRPTT